MDYINVINDLNNQLSQTRAAIKNGGLSAAMQLSLTTNQDILQNLINKLVNSNNLSQDDLNSINNALTESKRKTLQAESERTKKTVLIIGIGILVTIGGIIFYYYKTRKK